MQNNNYTNILTFHFNGECSIDVNSMIAVTKCLKRVSKIASGNNDEDLNVELAAMREGSVIWDFICANAPMLADMFTIFTGFLELRKFLGGYLPNSVEGTNVTNYNGDNMVVDNRVISVYLGTDAAEKDFAELSKALCSSNGRAGFSIQLGNNIYNYSPEDVAHTKHQITKRVYNDGNVTFDDYEVNFVEYDSECKTNWKYKIIESGAIGIAKITADEFITQVKNRDIIVDSLQRYSITVKTDNSGKRSKSFITNCQPL